MVPHVRWVFGGGSLVGGIEILLLVHAFKKCPCAPTNEVSNGCMVHGVLLVSSLCLAISGADIELDFLVMTSG